jgi:hypothetical protein
MFEITLKDNSNKNRIEHIECISKSSRPEGLLELFWQLERCGSCKSYSGERIYYLAYLLAKEGIGIIVKEIEE